MNKWDGKSGYIIPEDVALIQKLARMLPNRHVNVVDLGAGSGTTALSVFSIRDAGIALTSIDVVPQALENTRLNMVQYGYITMWNSLKLRSDVAGKQWTAGLVDMLMCDATHDYASQQDELNAWERHLQPGTLVWIHEYAGYANGMYPGVKAAVDEFIAAGKLETIEVSGLSWGGKYIG